MSRRLVKSKDLRIGQAFWWASVKWIMGYSGVAGRVSKKIGPFNGRNRTFAPDEFVKVDNK